MNLEISDLDAKRILDETGAPPDTLQQPIRTSPSDDPLVMNDVGLTLEEAARARLKTVPPEQRGDPQRCAMCKQEIEPDGFCSWHGPIEERWLCDKHVHEVRFSGQHLAPKKPMTREDVEMAIAATEGAIKNLGLIDVITARDASGATRGFELSLTFKQSRPIFKAIREVLKLKLTGFPPPQQPVVEVDP